MNERVDCFIGFSRFGIRLRSCLCSLLLCAAALAQDAPHGQFRVLKVDAGKVIGEIHSFQAVNGPPSPLMAGLPNLVPQYKDLRIDLVRTHDFMGPTDVDAKFEQANGFLTWLIPDSAQRAGVVQAGNAGIIFPNWSADPDKP